LAVVLERKRFGFLVLFKATKKDQKKLQISLPVRKKGLYICSRLEKQRSQQQIEKKEIPGGSIYREVRVL
jgi:hypothetical protein